LPQPHPGPLVLVGFGGCTDINVDAIGFFESLGVDSRLPTTLRSDFDGKVELNSLEDVLAEFTEMFASGAAAERYVANKTLFNFLVEHATNLVTPSATTTGDTNLNTSSRRPRAYFSLGGNAPVMAKRLAREGAEVTLAARLSPRERAALPTGLRVISAPAAFGLPDVPLSDVHLILEYGRGSLWRNFTAPRANRYILIRDEENPRLSGLWSGLLPAWRGSANLGLLGKGIQSTPDLFVISGLQTMDNSALSPDIRPERLDHLKWFLSTQLTPLTLVHFELASFVETEFVRNLTQAILPYIDSIGCNEQELPNLVSLLSIGRVSPHASVSTPRAAVMLDGMREVWSLLTDPALPKVGPSRRRLSRIHLHTLGYQIIMVRRPVNLVQARKVEEEANASGEAVNIAELGRAWPFTRAAAAKASLIAHRHTCATAAIDPVLTRLLMDDSFAVTADPDRWASALLATSIAGTGLLATSKSVPRIHFNASAPVSCWYEPEPAAAAVPSALSSSPPPSRQLETRVEICVAPVPVCSKVTRTVGAGDNISAGALRAQLTTRAHRNRGPR
uniref:PfkB domain-containing protein n=1 Tax=Schistocephalus solidus TaxID=70667 RepID=A0A183TC36_SCHSO